MSDEINMQAALRHADAAALLPWQARTPDEELMAKEDGEMNPESLRAAMVEVLFTYLFADSGGRAWQMVALRIVTLAWEFAPGIFQGRDIGEVEKLNQSVNLRERFSFREFEKLARYDGWQDELARLIRYLYPPRARWLFRGTRGVYLLARAFQPWLVKVDGKEMTFEEMAEVLEGACLRTRKERGRARSRWSARVQQLLRVPIERAGGTVRLQFGKSAHAREAMARSAKGNGNRRVRND